MLFTHFVRNFLLPPGCLLLLLGAGLLVGRRRPRAGRLLCGLATVLLYLLSIPPVARTLMGSLEVAPALSLAQARQAGAQAIVVLGGGYVRNAPEYAAPNVTTSSLVRLRYGNWLQRQTGLPMLLAGGNGLGGDDSEAGAMRRVAREDYGLEQLWLEDQSRTTHENAEFSAPILRQQGVKKILLVSDALHLRRAGHAFERLGFEVVLAPTRLETPGPWDHGIFVLLPSSSAFIRSSDALEEWLGCLFYRLRYG